MVAVCVPGTHLSVRVLSGPRTLLTKIYFTALNLTFGELFLKPREEDECVGQGRVCKVTIGERAGNAGGTGVDLMAPVTLCEGFKCKYVTFFVTNDASAMATSRWPLKRTPQRIPCANACEPG